MISAVTVTFNSEATIARLVNSLSSRLGASLSEIVVIDNRSTDGTRKVLRILQQEMPLVRVVENGHNDGYRKAVNQAIRLAQSEVILVINPDAWVEDDSVYRCLEQMAADPAIGYISPAIIEPGYPEPSVHTTVIVPFLYGAVESIPLGSRSRNVEVAAGPAFLVRRSLFLRCGGYDEGIFMYTEEEEICSKLRSIGAKVKVEPSAQVHHDGGHSVRTVGPRLEFLLTRLLQNARYLYLHRSMDSHLKRYLWSAFFLLRGVEYSIAIGSGSPLHVVLSPWNGKRLLSPQAQLMEAVWHLRFWPRAWFRELQDYLTSEFDPHGRIVR